MADVTVKQVPLPLQHEPEIRIEFAGESSTVSQITWRNPSVLRALSTLFAIGKGEKLAAVVLTREGIKAEIGRD